MHKTKTPSTEIPNPEVDLDEDASRMKWAKFNGKLDIHRISGSVYNLLLEMDHQWLKYITHSCITNTQFEYIRKLKESLPVDIALMHIDFTENYISFLTDAKYCVDLLPQFFICFLASTYSFHSI